MTPVKKKPTPQKRVAPRDKEMETRQPLTPEELSMFMFRREEAIQSGKGPEIDVGQNLKFKVLGTSIVEDEIVAQVLVSGKVWREGTGAEAQKKTIAIRIPCKVTTYGKGRPGSMGADSAGDDRPS